MILRRPRHLLRTRLAGAGAVLGLTLIAVATMPAPTRTGALFTAVEAETAVLAADVLDPPTGLTATGGASTALTWTPTSDGYAGGYLVERATAAAGPYVEIGSAAPGTASGLVDSPVVDGTYWYRVRSWASSWRSAPAGPVSTTIRMGITGFHACTGQAADTGGDGNGFQVSPGNGCDVDGSVATDRNSGTGTSTSCTSTTKDRHRFSGFGLGVPATAIAIKGITVRYRAGIDATTGTNRICVQLSWNAGSSWTAAQLAPITTTGLTTYTLGGPLFLWGRAWTASQLTDANFRLRVIDVSSNNARDFRLDGVEVRVDYTP